MDWNLKQTEHSYEPPCKTTYELNIECNELHVSLSPATANQLIGWCFHQVSRGESLQQLCSTVCSSTVFQGLVEIPFRCSNARLCLTARSFVLCSTNIWKTMNDVVVYCWLTNVIITTRNQKSWQSKQAFNAYYWKLNVGADVITPFTVSVGFSLFVVGLYQIVQKSYLHLIL